VKSKEFVSELSEKLGFTVKNTNQLLDFFVSDITEELQNGNSANFSGFGSFEVKKKDERIIVNPTTKQRMLVPPKLVLNFRPSTILKEKFK